MDQNKIGIIKLILNINSTNYNLNNWTLYTQYIYIYKTRTCEFQGETKKEGRKERKKRRGHFKEGGEGMSEREKWQIR